MQRLEPLHVLIVDDESDVAEMLSLLVSTSFEALVETAESCSSAREKMESTSYDLITLDQQLPDGTGLQLLEEIAAAEERPPVIMVTGHGDEQTAVSAFKLGADGYVVKDHRLSTLLVQEINSAIAKVALERTERDLRASRELHKHAEDTLRRREVELKEADARLESLLKSSRAVLYVASIEEDFPAKYITENVRELFGYDQSSFLDEKDFWISNVHPDDIATIEPAIQLLFKKGTNVYDYRFLHKDGKYRWVRDDMRLIRDERGEPSEVVGFFTDITDRKEAEQELRTINLELDSYAQGVSHDIKGPLSAALVSCEVLKREIKKVHDSESQAVMLKLLELVSGTISRSIRVTEDLLRFAQAGRSAELSFPVEVSKVVQGILEENAQEIETKRIQTKIGADLGRVRGNQVHIYQLFSNLIGNAVKYNDNPEPVIEVSYLGDDETEGHRYLVRDNGSGIPQGDVERVFEPFFAHDSGATGVGLSIVKKVVDLYKGEISAYNDGGACFEFVIRDLR